MTKPKLKCAVYTRKSTDEGLDQEFNSLDAQWEACGAFVKSQIGEGWSLNKKRYDDGGVSGGTLERPALQELLEDIRLGRVDVVVVYKVDRLTRSLADFAKLVELFDTHQVSFVSVTQAFNTTSSMGRLTLNVLLSFAQFEREVTAERIRDKIAASKKKGMWMGGSVPLGYDVREKKLIINQAEAKTVRTIFDLYRNHKNVRVVQVETEKLGLLTKARGPGDGGRNTPKPFQRGPLYHLLSNPLYVGKVQHKEHTYEGEHDAIIEQTVWQEVQEILATNCREGKIRRRAKHPALLAGVLFDESGEKLSTDHANKNGRRHRYYISTPHSVRSSFGTPIRIPATELETAVFQATSTFLQDQHQLSHHFPELTADQLEAVSVRAQDLSSRITDSLQNNRRETILKVFDRITFREDSISISLRKECLLDEITSDTIEFTNPIQIKRRGVSAKLVLHAPNTNNRQPDPTLIRLVAQSIKWFDDLKSGNALSITEIAHRDQMDRNEISRLLPLAFLAPDLVEQILKGEHPVSLTANRLKRISNLPMDWQAQRNLFASF